MNRVSLGLTAVLLLIIGIIVAVQQPECGAAFAGACIRVGMVLAALWLAAPQVASFWKKTPKWLLVAGAVALVVCVIHPIYALAAVPLLGLLWFLGPRLTSFWKPTPGSTTAAEAKPAKSPAAEQTPVAPARQPRRRSNAR
jgi:hypothetical protein